MAPLPPFKANDAVIAKSALVAFLLLKHIVPVSVDYKTFSIVYSHKYLRLLFWKYSDVI